VHHPDIRTEIVVIRTTGDKHRRDPLAQLGTTGLFVKEIEEALLRQDIDLAVHSMKDMPTTLPPGLHCGAVPRRGEVRDAFVGRDGRRLSEIDGPWRLGTGSRRRQAQLLARHPTLQMHDIRGNVETRLRKMRQGEVDGLVLAATGLIRLGLQHEITELLPLEVMLPAPGQGALALETLAGHWVDTVLAPVHDPQRPVPWPSNGRSWPTWAGAVWCRLPPWDSVRRKCCTCRDW
jgi:hydroxymethylbilane synthase